MNEEQIQKLFDLQNQGCKIYLDKRWSKCFILIDKDAQGEWYYVDGRDHDSDGDFDDVSMMDIIVYQEVDTAAIMETDDANESSPPKTNDTYIKCNFVLASEAITCFEDKQESLYTNVSSSTFSKIDNAPDVLRYFYRLYKKGI